MPTCGAIRLWPIDALRLHLTALYNDIGNNVSNAYNSGLGYLPSSLSNPVQDFVSGTQGQSNGNPSVANFLGNNLRNGFTNILDSVAPTISGTDVRFAFGLGTRDVLMQNKAVGAAFENLVGADLRQTGLNIGQQVTVETANGVRTRLDFITQDPTTGEIGCLECKASATAPLTPNQTIGFPQIEQNGGTIVGAGKPGFPGGTQIPPTKVQIIRGP